MNAVATDLVVRLGDTDVLDRVSLTLVPGEFACIVGPNGAGKTTLLRCIAGDLAPDGGVVQIDGRDVVGMSMEERAAARAFLAQTEREDIPYTVAEVVRFGTYLSTLDPDRQEERVTTAMDALAISEVSHRVVATLSGGERRRVALARTLSRATPLVLFDEPTDSLDIGHANIVMALLAAEARVGRTVAATSHDLNLASRHGDRVVILHEGRIVVDGPPSEVLTEATLSEVYACAVTVIAHPADGRPVVFI